jgi:hypothetical protein
MGENSRLIIAGSGNAFSSLSVSLNNINTGANSSIEFIDTSNNDLNAQLGGTGSYENVIFNRGSSTGAITKGGSGTGIYQTIIRNFRDLGTAAHRLQIGDNTHTFLDTFDVKGSSPSNLISIVQDTGGSGAGILKKGNPGLVVCDNLIVDNVDARDYNNTTTQGTWFAGPNSTLISALGWSTTGSHATASIVRRLGSQGAG